MEKTLAYAEESRTFIWINLKGREPKGIVHPGEEYESVCETIIRGLKSLKDPVSNEPVVKDVYRKEDVYRGTNLEKAPDLVVLFEKGGFVPRPSYNVSPNVITKHIPKGELEQLEVTIQADARHHPDGIVMLWGANIKQGEQIKGAEIIDLAPTILCLMKEAIPDDMDGEVLTEAVSGAFLKENQIRYIGEEVCLPPAPPMYGYSETEADKIRSRLKDLGYLD